MNDPFLKVARKTRACLYLSLVYAMAKRLAKDTLERRGVQNLFSFLLTFHKKTRLGVLVLMCASQSRADGMWQTEAREKEVSRWENTIHSSGDGTTLKKPCLSPSIVSNVCALADLQRVVEKALRMARTSVAKE